MPRRPTGTPMCVLSVRCSHELVQAVGLLADEREVTRGEAARRLLEQSLVYLLGSDAPVRPPPPRPPTSSELEIRRLLASLANNANQIAHTLNRARVTRQDEQAAINRAVAGYQEILTTVRHLREEIAHA